MIENITISDADVKRFFSKVAITANNEKCWLWRASTDRRGYGRFHITNNKKKFGMRAPRISFFIANGIGTNGKLVCHSCDNPNCVNPKHLFLGTSLDNTQDMMNKGRNIFQLGSEHHNSIITEEVVLKIREYRKKTGYTYQKIADVFNIKKSHVTDIILKRRWAHI